MIGAARSTYRVRRRGGVYILVLGVSLVVFVLGMGTLLAARSQRYAALRAEKAVRADLAAQSFVDVMTYRLTQDVDWRTTYANDKWNGPEVFGGVAYRFKLVDELDGDLANDDQQPVRLYAEATVDDAVRIYSVRLLPPDEKAANLLDNGDIESGLSKWTSTDAQLAQLKDTPHGGKACLWVYNRSGEWDGARQDVGPKLENGGTYKASVWVNLAAGIDQVRLVLWMDTSEGYYSNYYAGQLVNSGWTEVTGTVTVSWSGELFAAYWEVETRWTNQDYGLDDATFLRVDELPPMIPVPGTWRREVLP